MPVPTTTIRLWDGGKTKPVASDHCLIKSRKACQCHSSLSSLKMHKHCLLGFTNKRLADLGRMLAQQISTPEFQKPTYPKTTINKKRSNTNPQTLGSQ
jgi:hypothetical protein